MKFLIPLLCLLAAFPVFAEPLSDRTGMNTIFDVRISDKIFEVKSTANYDIKEVKFDGDKMILDITSSLNNNLGELQLPKDMTSGPLGFYLDGAELPVKILQNEQISFVTLEFGGNGTHTLEIVGDYVSPVDAPPAEGVSKVKIDQIPTIIAVVGVVVAIGVGSTIAYYFKTKPKTA